MNAILQRLKQFFRKAPAQDVLDREMDFHLEELAQAHVAAGVPLEEARRRARLEFGGREQVRQSLRDVHASPWLEALRGNTRAAIRFARHSPLFAFTVVATLALGIGANSAVFSAVDAILLRPLPFPHADELVRLQQYDFKHQDPENLVAPVRVEDWNRLNSTFTAISGWYSQDVSLLTGSAPERVSEGIVAPRFLQVLGVSPQLGRDFDAQEEHFGGPAAVLLSDHFWRSHGGANPRVLNTRIKLGDFAYSVVGVMPRSVGLLYPGVDAWVMNAPDAPYAQDRNSTWFTAIGRLKPGVSLAQAQADLAAVQGQLGRQFPKPDADLSVAAEPLKSVVLQDAGGSLWLLYGSVSLLLLIASTNIAALLLARTAERQHEIAIRYALGASRGKVVLQLLSEVFLLALGGSLLALLLAGGAAHLFRTFAHDLPRVAEIALNWRIVLYTLGCALAATLACGLLPALRSSRRALASDLAGGTRTLVSTRVPLQWLLVGAQIALAVALLVGAGLLLRSFAALGRVRPGFDASHVLTLHISGGYGETADMGKLTQRIDRDLDGLRSVPGVEAAATSATLPGVAGAAESELRIIEGHADPNRKITADERLVSPGYLAVLHIPLLTGQACREGLPYGTAMVNRSFAQAYLAGSAGLGFHLASAANTLFAPSQIVGIVGDAREEGLATPPGPTVYWCLSASGPDPNFLIRTRGNPLQMAETLRRAIQRIEPSRSVYDVLPLTAELGEQSSDSRLRTALLTLVALTAIALVSIGLYGTVSYLGRIREGEVGLRLALGALPGQIVRSFLLQSLRVAAFGCAAGLLLGAGLGALCEGLLYGVSALDPLTYAAVALLVLAVTTAASLVPSLRAARVEPTRVLRSQ